MYSLVWPMLAMFLWTFLVSLRNLQVRVAALQARQLRESYFEIFAGEAPEVVVKTSNHLRNLTEFPPLYYVGMLLVIWSGHGDPVFVALAWAYVGFRFLHSLVHLTINRVKPRFSMFVGSQLVLLAIWLRLAWQLAGQGAAVT